MNHKERDELKNKFKTELYEEEWVVMAPHYKRGAFIIVSEELDLVEVATAVSVDDSGLVQAYIDQKKILKPTEEQVQEWEKNKQRFVSVIVQPFVLAKIKK